MRKLERSIYIFIKIKVKGLPLKGKVGKYTLFKMRVKTSFISYMQVDLHMYKIELLFAFSA